MKGAALFSEALGDNDPATALRAHLVLVEAIGSALRHEMAGGGGMLDSILVNPPPPGVLPALAWVLLAGDAVSVHVSRAGDIFQKSAGEDGASPEVATWLASAALPDCAWWMRHYRAALAHLFAQIDAWCETAEAEARQRDHAATEVAAGRAMAHLSGNGLAVFALPAA